MEEFRLFIEIYRVRINFFFVEYWPMEDPKNKSNNVLGTEIRTLIIRGSSKWVRRLWWVENPGPGISPPDVGELSRRFDGAMAFIVKGGVSIVDQLQLYQVVISPKTPWIQGVLYPLTIVIMITA